jgi:SAM-dependent MidA family methyltransferase
MFEIVPADGHYGCQLQEHGDFGTSPSFKQLFGQAGACLLAYIYETNGRPEAKEQEELPAFGFWRTFNSSISPVVRQAPPQ